MSLFCLFKSVIENLRKAIKDIFESNLLGASRTLSIIRRVGHRARFVEVYHVLSKSQIIFGAKAGKRRQKPDKLFETGRTKERVQPWVFVASSRWYRCDILLERFFDRPHSHADVLCEIHEKASSG